MLFYLMNKRLNSFYSNEHPPFADAMGAYLKEAGSRARRPGFITAMMTGTTNKWIQDKEYMLGLAKKGNFIPVDKCLYLHIHSC
jgi:cytochrome P450/NADPH-cytochrome P450 reductase